jgi:hypothetical protein
MASNYIAGHLPAARGAKKSADRNLRSPDGYAKDSSPAFVIHFEDQFGNEILWKFAVGEIVPHASPRVIFRTDNSGMGFLYATPGTQCRWHDSENRRPRIPARVNAIR